jgi:hypothetical protein
MYIIIIINKMVLISNKIKIEIVMAVNKINNKIEIIILIKILIRDKVVSNNLIKIIQIIIIIVIKIILVNMLKIDKILINFIKIMIKFILNSLIPTLIGEKKNQKILQAKKKNQLQWIPQQVFFGNKKEMIISTIKNTIKQ